VSRQVGIPLPSRAARALIVVILLGILACLLGIQTCISYANRLLDHTAGDPVADIAGRGLVVIAMTCTCLLSTVMACLVFGLGAGNARLVGAAAT
jgi:hypothetical protein